METELEKRSLRMGMDAYLLESAFRLLDAEAESGQFPGATAAVARRGDSAAYATGWIAGNGDAGTPATVDSIYDCASLTKVVVTLPLILMLIDTGKLRLDDAVSRFFPAFAAEGKQGVTVGQLLTHTSGLPAWRDLGPHGPTPGDIFAYICDLKPEAGAGEAVVYSCLGFVTLGFLAEKLFDMPLDQAAEAKVFRPLGMRSSAYNPPAEWLPRIAATEKDERSGIRKHGAVHDENAFALGGVSGNAGLFASAGDLVKYARMWLASGRTAEGKPLLSPAAIRTAAQSRTGHLPQGNRGLGWVLKGDAWDASGDYFSIGCFGHTGFTGTSLWIDPAADLVAVLLTNRVYGGRETSVARLRCCFHNAVAAAVKAETI